MPNIRMLQAAREMAEKEKLVQQGKVKAKRSQETDTRDVADKTNKSEVARTIKKAEQDNRSAKNELSLSEKKAANAQKQKNIAMVGAVISIALGAVQAGADGARAEKNSKLNDANKASKSNENSKATIVEKTRENKKLGNENESIKEKLKDSSINEKDKGKLEDKLKSNTETIKTNTETIKTNTESIKTNTETINKIKNELQGDGGKGFLSKAADSLKSAFGGGKESPAPTAPTATGDKTTKSEGSAPIESALTGTTAVDGFDPKSDGRATKDIEVQSYDLAASVANHTATEADTNQLAKNEAVLSSRDKAAPVAEAGKSAGTTGQSVEAAPTSEVAPKGDTKGSTEAAAPKAEVKGGTEAAPEAGKAAAPEAGKAVAPEAGKAVAPEASKSAETNTANAPTLTEIDGGNSKGGGVVNAIHDASLGATNAVFGAGNGIKDSINGFGVNLGKAIGGLIGKPLGELAGGLMTKSYKDSFNPKSSTTAPATATDVSNTKLVESGRATSTAGAPLNEDQKAKVLAKINGVEKASKSESSFGMSTSKEVYSHNNAGQIASAERGMLSSQDNSNQIRGNIDLLDKANPESKNHATLTDADKKQLESMGVKFGDKGQVNKESLNGAMGVQALRLSGSEKEYGQFAQMKNFYENNSASKAEGFAVTNGNTAMKNSIDSEKGGNAWYSLISGTSSSSKNDVIADLNSLSAADRAKIGQPGMDSAKQAVDKAGDMAGGNVAKFAALDPKVRELITQKDPILGFNKETGQLTATTGGVMGIGGNTDKIQAALAGMNPEEAKKTIEAIGSTDPQAAGKILSDMAKKDPDKFAKVTSSMTPENLGKFIGGAIDSKTISASEGKAMLDVLDKPSQTTPNGQPAKVGEPSRSEKVMDQIASNNPDAANKLFDAGANMSNEAFEKMVGGAKIGNTQKASTFNSALLMLNLAGPAIQMYLQAIDKLREAHEQRDEALKKIAASQKLINKLRGDLQRLEGNGESAGGGMQGAQAGTGGAR